MADEGNGQTKQLAVARPALMIQAATDKYQLTLSVPEAEQLRDQLDFALKAVIESQQPKKATKGKAPASARARRSRGQAPAKN